MNGCTGLTSVTFPKESGYIYMNGCIGLTSVTFPDKVYGSISMDGCTGLTSVTFPKESGSISMDGCIGLTSVTFPKESGYISMNGCTGLTSVTSPKESGYIYMDEKTSEYLLSYGHKKTIYQINNVQFDKPLFDQVRHGELSASQVFAIRDMEQRRVAYEKMDKIKMKELEGFAVIDKVEDDGKGYPMQVVQFSLPGFKEPFRYLACHCPTEGRGYFLETRETECWKAKSASFGLPADIEWAAEY
jgi:hypothetical protein